MAQGRRTGSATPARAATAQDAPAKASPDSTTAAKAAVPAAEAAPTGHHGLWYAAGVLVLAATCAWCMTPRNRHNVRGHLAPPLSGVIDRRDLSESELVPEDIVSMAAPVVMSAKNLRTIWPVVSERLSLASIVKRKSLQKQMVPGVRVHETIRTFVPATQKPGQVSHRLAQEAEYRYENWTLGELLGRMQGTPADAEVMQASTPVQDTELEKWTLDIGEYLFVNDTREAQELSMPSFASTTVFWASQPGTVSNLHYDRSHNFYVMLGGTKTFTLMPPSEWPYVYLHPWLHPSYHQSQVFYPRNGTQVANAFPAYAEARNISITLHRGDILYVPPYWFHRVETAAGEEPGLSLSVVSPSRDEMFYSDAYWKLKPFSEAWGSKLRVIAVRQALTMLFEKLDMGESAPEFIRRSLVNSRYSQPGVMEAAKRMATSAAEDCYANSRISDPDTLAIFSSAIENGTASLREISSRDVLALSLGNLVEEMLRFAVGSYNLAAHLDACYS